MRLAILLCYIFLFHQVAAAQQPPSTRDPQQYPAKLEVLAEQGDKEAQYRLGHHYLTGSKTGRDPRKAAFWFNKAARNGHVVAQRALATMYFSGLGVRKAPAHALKWFLEAAKNGDAAAQAAAADMYYRGTGMSRPDLKQAWRWMMASAENGDAMAQYRVGLMFRDGRGTRTNLSRAFLWLHVAALNMADEALRHQIVAARDEVGKQMSARQLSKTKARSGEFAEKYAKKG